MRDEIDLSLGMGSLAQIDDGYILHPKRTISIQSRQAFCNIIPVYIFHFRGLRHRSHKTRRHDPAGPLYRIHL